MPPMNVFKTKLHLITESQISSVQPNSQFVLMYTESSVGYPFCFWQQTGFKFFFFFAICWTSEVYIVYPDICVIFYTTKVSVSKTLKGNLMAERFSVLQLINTHRRWLCVKSTCEGFVMSRSDSHSLYIEGFITNALFIIDLPSSLCSTILLYHYMIDSALHHILLWSTNPFQHLRSFQLKWNAHYNADSDWMCCCKMPINAHLWPYILY